MHPTPLQPGGAAATAPDPTVFAAHDFEVFDRKRGRPMTPATGPEPEPIAVAVAVEPEPARERVTPPARETHHLPPIAATVDAPHREMWNVVAPAGSDTAVASALEVVLAEHPDANPYEMSCRIAERVPGARVGPLVRPDDEWPNGIEETDDDPTGVFLPLSDSDRAVLQVLVDTSTVFTTIHDVVRSMLRSQIDMARDDLTGGALEALRYIGGMTDDEKTAYDAGT